jgi:hypothetical protein
MSVVRVVRQTAPSFDWLNAFRKDRDAVESLLAVPNRAITRALDRELGKRSVRSFQLLQANNVRTRFFEPFKKSRQTARDPINVECGNF